MKIRSRAARTNGNAMPRNSPPRAVFAKRSAPGITPCSSRSTARASCTSAKDERTGSTSPRRARRSPGAREFVQLTRRFEQEWYGRDDSSSEALEDMQRHARDASSTPCAAANGRPHETRPSAAARRRRILHRRADLDRQQTAYRQSRVRRRIGVNTSPTGTSLAYAYLGHAAEWSRC